MSKAPMHDYAAAETGWAVTTSIPCFYTASTGPSSAAHSCGHVICSKSRSAPAAVVKLVDRSRKRDGETPALYAVKELEHEAS